MKSYPNPLYTKGSGLYSHYEVAQVAEYPDVSTDGRPKTFCEPVQEDGPGGDAIRTFWTIYGRFNPEDGAGIGREAVIDADTEAFAMEHLQRMGVYPAVKLFLIIDHSGRGVAVVQSEQVIRKGEDPDNPTTMDDGKELHEFLDDAEVGDEGPVDQETYIRVL